MEYKNLYKYGLNEEIIKETLGWEHLYLARVCIAHRNMYEVVSEDGHFYAHALGKLMYNAKSLEEFPTVGDWVLIDRLDGKGGNAIIHKVLKRKSTMVRKAAGSSNDLQIIVSNVDKIFICMSLNDDFNLRRVERYLTIVWDSGAMPIIVLTKSDLCQDLEDKLNELSQVSMGAEVLTTSAKDGSYSIVKDNIKPGETVAFVGSSGVGKSTLINCIIGEELLKTNEIRQDDSKGKHTTTYRQLIAIDNGGIVIDTPGMRELQIHTGDMETSFADIYQLAKSCKFRNCTHASEAGCRINEALESGELSPKRYDSYKKLQLEMSYEGLSSKQVEGEKFKRMFGSKSGYKQVKEYSKRKNR